MVTIAAEYWVQGKHDRTDHVPSVHGRGELNHIVYYVVFALTFRTLSIRTIRTWRWWRSTTIRHSGTPTRWMVTPKDCWSPTINRALGSCIPCRCSPISRVIICCCPPPSPLIYCSHTNPENPDDYFYPSTGRTYGQSFLCISVNASEIDTIGLQLVYNEAVIYTFKVSENLR